MREIVKSKNLTKEQNGLNIVFDDNRNVYQNTAQDYILTTKDKLELVLLKAEKNISSKNSWKTPLGMVVSCILALLSSNFKDFILPANVWYAFFIITTIICFCWFCYTVYLLVYNWNKGNTEDIINKVIAVTGN